MPNKYLVQSDWLTELPTRARPSMQLHDEKGKEQAQSIWESHLASLPKICRCEGLKDGAIVEEGVDYKIIQKRTYTKASRANSEWTDEPVAIPLHREQGNKKEYNIEGWNGTPTGEVTPDHPTPAGKEETDTHFKEIACDFAWENGLYNAGMGYQKLRLLFDKWLSENNYHKNKLISPQSEQAGEKNVKQGAAYLINCLAYALRFWEKEPSFKLYYCSGHVINSHVPITVDGWLPAEDFGYVYFSSAFKDLLNEYETDLLKKYFNQ